MPGPSHYHFEIYIISFYCVCNLTQPPNLFFVFKAEKSHFSFPTFPFYCTKCNTNQFGKKEGSVFFSCLIYFSAWDKIFA